VRTTFSHGQDGHVEHAHHNLLQMNHSICARQTRNDATIRIRAHFEPFAHSPRKAKGHPPSTASNSFSFRFCNRVITAGSCFWGKAPGSVTKITPDRPVLSSPHVSTFVTGRTRKNMEIRGVPSRTTLPPKMAVRGHTTSLIKVVHSIPTL